MITITGTNYSETINGTDKDENILGKGGDDWLSPGGGVNTVDGGNGIDTASFEFEVQSVTVDLSRVNNGYSVATGESGSVSKLTNIENLYGGAGNDSLTGNSGANTIGGNSGIDTINGGGGKDLLFGGAGTDFLNGGEGNDTLNGYGRQPGQPAPIRQFREFDELIGGLGNDTFVLGDKQEAYYRGGGSATIKDFKQGDTIQLKGPSSNYSMLEVSQEKTGTMDTLIYHGANTGNGNDLVATLTDVQGLSFTNTNTFSFVQ